MKKWQNCTFVHSVQSSLFFSQEHADYNGVKVEGLSRALTVIHIERLRPLSTHGLMVAERRLGEPCSEQNWKTFFSFASPMDQFDWFTEFIVGVITSSLCRQQQASSGYLRLSRWSVTPSPTASHCTWTCSGTSACTNRLPGMFNDFDGL